MAHAQPKPDNSQQAPSNTTVITNDNCVIYDEKIKQLIGVKSKLFARKLMVKRNAMIVRSQR